MVLVVLTDRNAAAAIKRLFIRTGFLLIPISVLLIKDYPALSRGYYSWTWTSYYKGVSTDKNGLGATCLIFGMASVWQFVEAFRAKTGSHRTRSLAAHGIAIAMTLWLLHMANSSTSMGCLVLGSFVIVVSSGGARRDRKRVHIVAAGLACLALCSYVFEDAYSSLVHALGRESNLTGRTDIWNDVLHLDLNPVIGTGFESFWLGPRAV